MTDEDIYSPPAAELEQAGTAGGVLNLASRWARLGAAIADGLILVTVTAVAFYGTEYWHKAMAQTLSLQETLLWLAFTLVAYLLLNGYLLQRRGQSLGKWMLGIRIVDAGSNALPPLWRLYLVRYLPQMLVAMIPLAGGFLILINDLFIFRADRRCGHDWIAGTRVVVEAPTAASTRA